MHRQPIENKGRLKIIQGQEKKYVYAIPEINPNLVDDPLSTENEAAYISCYSCESIRQRMENHEPLAPFAVRGWEYVEVSEAQNYFNLAPEKVSFLTKMGFDELKNGLWCRECGSAVLAKTYMREMDDKIEISFSFNKDDEQVDKIVFKLPGKSSLIRNTTLSQLGSIVFYNDIVFIEEIELTTISSTEYTIVKNSEIIGRLTLNPNRNELSLTINRTGTTYPENITYSLFILKNWFSNLDTIDKYDVLQVAIFNNGVDQDIFIDKYVGYVKLNNYNEVHDPTDDWDPKWPTSSTGGGGTNPDPSKEGVKNVLVWGVNNFGQLGDGTTVDRVVQFNSSGQIIVPANPVLNLMTDAVKVISGKEHAVAIKDDKTVWTWGRNSNGQLGLNFRDDSSHSFPSRIFDLGNIVDVAGGWFHTVALEGDGTVWTFGGNYKGQLGDGTNVAKSRPIQVRFSNGDFLTNIKAVAAGAERTIALDNNGNVWEWGEDQFYPKMIENLSDIVSIATGTFHSLALKSDGTVWAWGYNWSGQLGIGFEDYPNLMNEQGEYEKAVQVLGLSDIKAIDCGAEHSLALKNDGTLWSWGNNGNGQLGLGTINMNKYYPVQISSLSNVKLISAGEYHNFIVRDDNTVWAWGDNSKGQLCLNNYDTQTSPVFVEIIPEIQFINCGSYHNFAIKVPQEKI